jgi:hypothetical protein
VSIPPSLPFPPTSRHALPITYVAAAGIMELTPTVLQWYMHRADPVAASMPIPVRLSNTFQTMLNCMLPRVSRVMQVMGKQHHVGR